ncbi:MAG: hypothetical protein WC777_00890 [Candidatus Gracilibacteria bacterium]|jgi:hypothetical protein
MNRPTPLTTDAELISQINEARNAGHGISTLADEARQMELHQVSDDLALLRDTGEVSPLLTRLLKDGVAVDLYGPPRQLVDIITDLRLQLSRA